MIIDHISTVTCMDQAYSKSASILNLRQLSGSLLIFRIDLKFHNGSKLYELKRDFGSIWAVGLHVCPPVRLPDLLVPARLVSHAPCHPLSLRRSRSRSAHVVCPRSLLAARACLPPDPRPSTSVTPRGQRDSPIIIYRCLAHICHRTSIFTTSGGGAAGRVRGQLIPQC